MSKRKIKKPPNIHLCRKVSPPKKGKVVGINTQIMTFLERYLRLISWTLCVLAMLRIFLFSAVFPFFNNVDEQAHYDTIVKYSKGYLPRQEANKYEPESAENIVLYGSPEYFKGPADFRTKEIPPPLWHNRSQLFPLINEWVNHWTISKNHEAFSPPVYYALAGMWYDLGKLSGLGGGNLIYWIRFLNIFIYASLFWATYLLCRKMFKYDLSMQFGVLLLLAFFPQDVFYSINSDVLSPLLCLISLYRLFEIYNSVRSLRYHLLTGIIVSATVLVKFSNIPILITYALLMAWKIIKLLKAKQLKEHLPKLLFLAAGCFLPIICWLAWNAYALGDITGNAEKTRDLGWSVKSFVDMWVHPIFSISGLTYFGSNLLKTFWRGEFVWVMQRIASEWMDLFYVVSSGVFVLLSIINSLVAKTDYSADHRFFNNISMVMLLLFILSLAVPSIMYDFGTCWYPSRENPFFTSGRLILGGLVPFLILYMDGLRIALSKISKRVNLLLAVVLLICIAITYSEIYITYPVAKSNYNWFHIH